MAESAVFLSEYYISAMYVLNFETLTAYPRSQIQKLESYKVSHTDSDGSYKGTDYCIRIWYGNGKKDRMVFAKTGTRDEVYEILKDGLQA